MSDNLVPDTLNLEESAALAINCLTRNVDLALNCTPYFAASLIDEPPALIHHYYWDYCCGTGQAVDALILARHMTGSTFNADVDEKLKNRVLSFIGDKGLCWIPKTPYREEKRSYSLRPEPPIAEFWGQRGGLMALLTWYQETRDSCLKKHIDGIIKGLWDIAIKKDEYCYYPLPIDKPPWEFDEFLYKPSGWETQEEPVGTAAMCACAVVIRPIVQYLETGSQNEIALRLCEGLSNYVVYKANYFGEDGSFRHHFHSRTATAASILKYGLYVNRMDLVEWARKVYGYARSIGTSFGWFPEFVGMEAGETCGITDMIDMAIMFAEAGWDEYWDHAERYGMNHLIESQFVNTEWLKKLPKQSKEETDRFSSDVDKRKYLRENVPDIMRGGFSGGSASNDIVDVRRGHWWMGCCNAHGVHGLYLLWHHAVQERKEGVFINLIFNRTTPWVDVKSYLPFEGKVTVKIKNAPVLFIRVPGLVQRNEVKVNGAGKEWMWVGRYVRITNLKPNDQVTVSYPIVEQEEVVKVLSSPLRLNDEYKVRWRGNTVVSIEPPGKIGPLYQRAHLIKEKAPLVKYTYHTPSQVIDW